MGESEGQLPVRPRRTLPAGMTPWKKGQSGNPTGINAVTKLMTRIREVTGNGDGLIKILLDAVKDRNASVRLRAVEILLERGWGKAMQPVMVSTGGSVLDLTKLSIDELRALSEMIGKIADGGGAARYDEENQQA